MATATEQLLDDPLGFGLDIFDRWSTHHIKSEEAKTANSGATAEREQGQLINAPVGVVERVDATPVTPYAPAGSPNVQFAGVTFNKTALYVVAAALAVIVFYKVVK